MPLPILEIVLPRGEKKRLSDFAAELTSHVDSDGNIFGVTIDCSAGECTLIFDGPMLLGSDIIGSNTSLVFQYLGHTFDKCINLMGDVGILSSCNFSGSFYCDCLYPELFGAKGDGVTDDREALQTCLDAAVDSGIFRVRMQPRTYLITDTLYYRGNLQLEGSYYTDNYHGEGSCILANLNEGVTPKTDLANNVVARHRNMLKFALETDCKYMVDNELVRIPVIESFNGVYYYNVGVENESGNTYREVGGANSGVLSVPPIHIRNVVLRSTNNSFGAIRAFGMVNSKIEGMRIHGFRVGLYLYEGWEFEVSRVHIRTGLAGLLAKNITCGLFNSVQIHLNNSSAPTYDEHHQPSSLDFADAPNESFDPGAPDPILNPYHAFMRNRVMDLAHYKQVYNHETIYENGDITNERDWIKTAAIYGSSLNATFNSCSMEGFDIGCIGYSLDCVFNLPYVESIKKTIAYVHKGYIKFNNMVGAQSLTKDYTYVAPEIVSKIVLNGCHAGTFYPTYSYNPAQSEVNNRNKFNYKSYVVKNHNKISKQLPYSPTSYLNYDVGDTIFIDQYHYTEFLPSPNDYDNHQLEVAHNDADAKNASLNERFGDYWSCPITLEAALDRIANNPNYRHVRYLYFRRKEDTISGNGKKHIITIGGELIWRSQQKELVLSFSEDGSEIVRFLNTQHILCNITFQNIKIDMFDSFCMAYGCGIQNLRFENCEMWFHNTFSYIIDNKGLLPTSAGYSNFISLFVNSAPMIERFYRDTWVGQGAATVLDVDYMGLSSAAVGANTSRPNSGKYLGYRFMDEEGEYIWEYDEQLGHNTWHEIIISED